MNPGRGSFGRRRLLVALAVVALVALAGCDGQVEREQVVCLSCQAAERAPIAPTNPPVEESTLTVRVHENGSSHWRAEVGYTNASAETLDRAADRTAAILREGEFFDDIGWTSVHEDGISDVRTETDPANDTLVVRYAVPGAAHRAPGGTLVVDYFHAKHDRDLGPFGLGADRVVVRGPPGWTATNMPPGASRTDDGAVAWAGSETRVSENTYVTFARNRSPVTLATGRIAVAADLVIWRGGDVAVASAFPVIVLALTGLALAATRMPVPTSPAEVTGRLRSRGTGFLASVAIGAVAISGTVVVLPLDWIPYRILQWALPVALALYGLLGVAASREHWAVWPMVVALTVTPVVAVSLHVFSAGGLHIGRATTAIVLAAWTVVVATLGTGSFFGARWATDRFA